MLDKLIKFRLIIIILISLFLLSCVSEYGLPIQNISSLNDLKGFNVGIYEGTVHDVFLATNYPEIKILRYNSPADMILSLKTNKTHAVLLDYSSALLLLKVHPEIGLVTDEVLSLPLGVGFNKNNISLLDEFNEFLKVIRLNGEYDEIHTRWFLNDPELAIMPKIDNIKSDRKLSLGVAVADLPYVAYMNNDYVGFDIEMIKRFAVYGGYDLSITTMEFASLVNALASGKVDMIADGIAITEERAKQINFSDEYAIFKTAMLSLKKYISDSLPIENSNDLTITFINNFKNSFYQNVIHENRYKIIISGLKVTFLISFFATLFGTLLGAVICFFRMSKNYIPVLIAKTFITILRGTPVLVLLMIVYYVIFASVNINPIHFAIFAFGLNLAAYVSEIFRTGIQGVDTGQTEAGIALGFSKVKSFIYIVLPQAIKSILPVYKGEIISIVKMTSIVGYIAVEDLTKAGDIIRSRTFDAFFPLIMVAVLYFLISWILIVSLTYLEVISDPKQKRKYK